MDNAHLHLLLNHFPILGSLFGLCLLIYGLLRNNRSLENAGLGTLVIIALITIPAFLTGEGAEDAVEGLPGVTETLMERHEEMAETALWVMIATGIAALAALIISFLRQNRIVFLKLVVALMAAATFGTMALTGNYGGEIRHTEIRSSTTVNHPENNADRQLKAEDDDDR